jgi:hypothetical protein
MRATPVEMAGFPLEERTLGVLVLHVSGCCHCHWLAVQVIIIVRHTSSTLDRLNIPINFITCSSASHHLAHRLLVVLINSSVLDDVVAKLVVAWVSRPR